MPFVIDASIAASWALPDEHSSVAQQALRRLPEDDALVPGIWWFEIRNLFVVNEGRSRISEHQTQTALELLAGLRIRVDRQPDEAAVLRLARQHRLTVYDAAYLELAQRQAVPLATLDRALINAARAEGVDLITA